VSTQDLTQSKLKYDLFEDAIDLDDQMLENWHFDIYNLNIFQICQQKNMSTQRFFTILKDNLEVMNNLDKGDAIRFDRELYSHDAIVAGNIQKFPAA
jgi:hypothetical protein